jgi:hypothetical protein
LYSNLDDKFVYQINTIQIKKLSSYSLEKLEKFALNIQLISIIIWVMLTCALRAQVKELEKEIKNKFYIESITFATFKILNAQVPKKTF